MINIEDFLETCSLLDYDWHKDDCYKCRGTGIQLTHLGEKILENLKIYLLSDLERNIEEIWNKIYEIE